MIATTFLGATSRVTRGPGRHHDHGPAAHGRRGRADRGQPGDAHHPPRSGARLRRRPPQRAKLDHGAASATFYRTPTGGRCRPAPRGQLGLPGDRDRGGRAACRAGRLRAAWAGWAGRRGPAAGLPGPRHRPAAGRRPVADPVRVPQPRTSPTRATPGWCRCSGRRRRSPRTRWTPRCARSTRLSGPATGLPPQLAVTTGDAIDNAQWNEVQTFLALFEGGLVQPDSGGPGYAGVQALDWPDDIFWKPDGDGTGRARTSSAASSASRTSRGCWTGRCASSRRAGWRMPWLSCFGNHEALNQGVGAATAGPGRRADRRPRSRWGCPTASTATRRWSCSRCSPEAFMAGPTRAVPADPAAGRSPGGSSWPPTSGPDARPTGHGFTEQNRPARHRLLRL